MTSNFTLFLGRQQLPSLKKTKILGKGLAQQLCPRDLLFLQGDLGTGKTTLAREIIQTLVGGKIHVPSPTFTLVNVYETPRCPLWHFDLYRLRDPEEIFELGLEEALGGGITLIEWPEKAYLPSPTLVCDFSLMPDGERFVKIYTPSQLDKPDEEL